MPSAGLPCSPGGVSPSACRRDRCSPRWLEAGDLRVDSWRDETTRAAAGWGRPPRHCGPDLHQPCPREPVLDRGRGGARAATPRLWPPSGSTPGRAPSQTKPLCTRGYVSSEAATFARHLEALPYQRCPPQRVATSDGDRLVVESIETSLGSAIDPEELQRVWTDICVWVHTSWPPVTPGLRRTAADQLHLRSRSRPQPDSSPRRRCGPLHSSSSMTPNRSSSLSAGTRPSLEDGRLSEPVSETACTPSMPPASSRLPSTATPHFRPILNEIPHDRLSQPVSRSGGAGRLHDPECATTKVTNV